MTYNLKGLKLDRVAAARVVRASRPDVLLVQEAPRGLLGGVRLAAFARAVGLEVVAGGRAGRGAAVLLRPELVHLVDAGAGVAIEPRWVRLRRGWPTPRGYAFVRLRDADGSPDVLTLVSVHLSALPAQRARHLPVYAALATSAAPGVVLGGDLNENPHGPSVRALQPPLHDADPEQAPTSPVGAPRTRLDGFLVGATVHADGVAVPSDQDVLVGSDHRPAVLTMSWTPDERPTG